MILEPGTKVHATIKLVQILKENGHAPLKSMIGTVCIDRYYNSFPLVSFDNGYKWTLEDDWYYVVEDIVPEPETEDLIL